MQHRLFAQVVHLLSDGAFTWMVWSTNQTQSQEHAGETTWPDVWSDICSFVWRGAYTMLPESPKKREKSVLLLMLPVFMFTPWPHQGGRKSRLLGPALEAPWSSIPICEGAAEPFHACATGVLFEILFKKSIKVADFAERIKKVRRDSNNKGGTRQNKRQDKGGKSYHLKSHI